MVKVSFCLSFALGVLSYDSQYFSFILSRYTPVSSRGFSSNFSGSPWNLTDEAAVYYENFFGKYPLFYFGESGTDSYKLYSLYSPECTPDKAWTSSNGTSI